MRLLGRDEEMNYAKCNAQAKVLEQQRQQISELVTQVEKLEQAQAHLQSDDSMRQELLLCCCFFFPLEVLGS